MWLALKLTAYRPSTRCSHWVDIHYARIDTCGGSSICSIFFFWLFVAIDAFMRATSVSHRQTDRQTDRKTTWNLLLQLVDKVRALYWRCTCNVWVEFFWDIPLVVPLTPGTPLLYLYHTTYKTLEIPKSAVDSQGHVITTWSDIITPCWDQ